MYIVRERKEFQKAYKDKQKSVAFLASFQSLAPETNTFSSTLLGISLHVSKPHAYATIH